MDDMDQFSVLPLNHLVGFDQFGPWVPKSVKLIFLRWLGLAQVNGLV